MVRSLFFLSFFCFTYGQFLDQFSLKANLGMTARFKGPDVESGFAIKDREPAMTDFYNGSHFYQFGLEYSGQTKESKTGHFFVGLSYIVESVDAKSKNEFKDLIGHHVDVNYTQAYFGYALYHNQHNLSNYYYLKLGYVHPDYSGDGNDGNSNFTTRYRNEASYFVSIGSNFKLSEIIHWNYEVMYMPMKTEPLMKNSSNGDHEPVDSNYEFHDSSIRASFGFSFFL